MTTMVSQITSRMLVYSTVYSDADQRKHQSSASLAFVWGIHRDRWIPRTKGQLRGICFHLMTSPWCNDGQPICWCHMVLTIYKFSSWELPLTTMYILWQLWHFDNSNVSFPWCIYLGNHCKPIKATDYLKQSDENVRQSYDHLLSRI